VIGARKINLRKISDMVNHVEGKESVLRSSRDELIQAFATELATQLWHSLPGICDTASVTQFNATVLSAVKRTPFPKLETEIHNHFYPTKDHVVYAVGEVVRIEPCPVLSIREGAVSLEEVKSVFGRK
jgi:hypothetical protein